MFKYKIIFYLLLTMSVATSAFCQGKPESHQIKIIGGTVVNIDTVGNVIAIRTEKQNQMAFFVPDKASITQETHEIGLMDIMETDPVTIQYYISSPGKYNAVSIMDNKPVVSDPSF